MKHLSLAMTAVIAAGGALIVALVIMSSRSDDRAIRTGQDSGPQSPGAEPSDRIPGIPTMPGFPSGPQSPQGTLSGSSGGLLHPLLGQLPEDVPAVSANPGLPPGLDPAQIERIRDENVKTVIVLERERLAREIAMFEGIMGPLEQETARRFLEVYNRHYEEAWRDFRDRVTRGETPSRSEVYRLSREKAYQKLDGILDPVQLDKFRKWWEEECREAD